MLEILTGTVAVPGWLALIGWASVVGWFILLVVWGSGGRWKR